MRRSSLFIPRLQVPQHPLLKKNPTQPCGRRWREARVCRVFLEEGVYLNRQFESVNVTPFDYGKLYVLLMSWPVSVTRQLSRAY